MNNQIKNLLTKIKDSNLLLNKKFFLKILYIFEFITENIAAYFFLILNFKFNQKKNLLTQHS